MSYHWRTIVGPAISYAHDTHRRQEFIDFCAGVEVRDDAGVWLQNDDLYCLHCGALITPNNLAFADADRNLICVDHGHNTPPKQPTNQPGKGFPMKLFYLIGGLVLAYLVAALTPFVDLNPMTTSWVSPLTYVAIFVALVFNFVFGFIAAIWIRLRDVADVAGKGPWWAG